MSKPEPNGKPPIFEQLGQALVQCGYPPLRSPDALLQIGDGAWHRAFLVSLRDGSRQVIRLRRQVAYGHKQPFDPQALREEYEPVGLYYRRANQIHPGICPLEYHFHLSPELTFTLETYQGPALHLPSLTDPSAAELGRQAGRLFRALDDLPAPLPGFGDLRWTGEALAAGERRPAAALLAEEAQVYLRKLEELSRSGIPADWRSLRRKLDLVLAERALRPEAVTLVNADVTPENLIAWGAHFSGLVDPRPTLHFPTHFAAFFLFCYRSLLPALAEAPRYARHAYRRHEGRLGAIADGFLDGYAPSEEVELRRRLQGEYWLNLVAAAWQAYRDYLGPRTEEITLRRGTAGDSAARLGRWLWELECLA